jgi:hypothetical protein
LEDAEKLYQKWQFKRHFIEEDEVLKVGATTIAVCSQWGIGNVGNLIARAKTFDYTIKEIKL